MNKEKMIKLLKKYHDFKTISRKTDISYMEILNFSKTIPEKEWKRYHHRKRHSKYKKVIKLRKKGLTYKQIAEKLDMEVHQVAGLVCSLMNDKDRLNATRKSMNKIKKRKSKELMQSDFSIIKNVKYKILKEKIREPICEICNWDYRKENLWKKLSPYFRLINIPLELHHMDGDNENNNLKNLQLLCPNCHSLQSNNKGRSPKKSKHNLDKITEDEIIGIRNDYKPYEITMLKLSKKYKMHPDVINRIVNMVDVNIVGHVKPPKEDVIV